MPSRSEAQVNALRLIAEGGVKVYEFRAGGRWRVTAPGGRGIGTATFRALERNGLVDRDTSTSLYEGQAVTLTEAGRAELPAPTRIEIVVYRDPDGATDLTYYVNGLPLTDGQVELREYHVDPGAYGTGEDWVADREADIKDASPAAAAKVRKLVGWHATA